MTCQFCECTRTVTMRCGYCLEGFCDEHGEAHKVLTDKLSLAFEDSKKDAPTD